MPAFIASISNILTLSCMCWSLSWRELKLFATTSRKRRRRRRQNATDMQFLTSARAHIFFAFRWQGEISVREIMRKSSHLSFVLILVVNWVDGWAFLCTYPVSRAADVKYCIQLPRQIVCWVNCSAHLTQKQAGCSSWSSFKALSLARCGGFCFKL